MLPVYDVIVVGAGHAGCEAAAAAANLDCKVLLITHDLTKIAQMSCNPAIGGIAKGQIVREIDALGGFTGIVTDKSMIQFRMLNQSKGPAMWSPRAQCDRRMFTHEWRKILEALPNLDFFQDNVNELLIKSKKIEGVKTNMGFSFFGKSVILTNGTFLNGLLHIGKVHFEGGRISELPSKGLTEQLKSIGFISERMKTGTPCRIDGRSVNFEILTEQKGDDKPGAFSFMKFDFKLPVQKSCYITYTNDKVHSILKKGFKDSPLFSGVIKGKGPRYCPSIEDKVVTFAEKEQHQLFLEPEGWDTQEYYLNGFSSSLPWEIQVEALHSVKGLENVKIFRPGYAIEYDFFDPTQLLHTLETKLIKNLFFAGQINGTTGYEEAAGQGLMAGINAALKIQNRDEFVLQRDDAYIGVLIDDLITKGVDEPYRMFTSRAEYRILLRQDNCDIRLTPKSYALGLASEERFNLVLKKMGVYEKLLEFTNTNSIRPDEANLIYEVAGSSPLKQSVKIAAFLTRPEVRLEDIIKVHNKMQMFINSLNIFDSSVLTSIEVSIKYASYIEREKQIADKLHRLEDIKLSQNQDYSSFQSLSTEARQKLNRIKPATIGMASRIPGISPSDINVLLIFLGR